MGSQTFGNCRLFLLIIQKRPALNPDVLKIRWCGVGNRLAARWPTGSRMPSEPVTRICFGREYGRKTQGRDGVGGRAKVLCL